MSTALATLGGGCFWCVDGALRLLDGVQDIACGYMGGHVAHPDYEQICTGTTGHAEVVQIAFDPARLSYRDLLEAFFLIHDPTTPNRQGHDVGPQYRSVIFAHEAQHYAIARELMAELEAAQHWPDPIVTELIDASAIDGTINDKSAVSPALTFWPAEAHHQDYFARHPAQPYCQAVIAPKLAKLRRTYGPRCR